MNEKEQFEQDLVRKQYMRPYRYTANDELQTLFELQATGNTADAFKAGKRAEFEKLRVSTLDRNEKLVGLRKTIADATKEIGELECLQEDEIGQACSLNTQLQVIERYNKLKEIIDGEN